MFFFINCGLISFDLRIVERNADLETNFLKKRIEEVEDVNTDFVGQTLFEKVTEGVKFFSNPMHMEEVSGTRRVKDLNETLENLRNEKRRLTQVQTGILYSNREKLRQIEELSDLLEEYRKKEGL